MPREFAIVTAIAIVALIIVLLIIVVAATKVMRSISRATHAPAD